MSKTMLKNMLVTAGGVALLGFILNATRGNALSDQVRGGLSR